MKPKLKPDWCWGLLPQEGRFHAGILRIGLNGKTFMAYAGIGHVPPSGTLSGISTSEVTSWAMDVAQPLVGGELMIVEIKTSAKADRRVRWAFDQVQDDGMVLFLSPDDLVCASVFQKIAEGRKV